MYIRDSGRVGAHGVRSCEPQPVWNCLQLKRRAGYSQTQLDQVWLRLNQRPRKTLGFCYSCELARNGNSMILTIVSLCAGLIFLASAIIGGHLFRSRYLVHKKVYPATLKYFWLLTASTVVP
jgi:hypothetical protein